MTQSLTLTPRPLFGGAITTSFPSTFLDASTLREVPDNQEVFVDMDTDQSVIVELLQLESEVGDEEVGA
jgi:hypothetical protein